MTDGVQQPVPVIRFVEDFGLPGQLRRNVAGITGGEQDLHVRSRELERSRKRDAISTWQNDVGDQKVDRLARPEQRLGFVRTRCGLYR